MSSTTGNTSIKSWKPPPDGVVKLQVAHEVRRIMIGRLLNKHSQFAYKKLLTIALDFQDELNTDLGTNMLPKQRVVFTYKDKDGDIITITTRNEFLEAWEHIGGSMMRVTASYRNLKLRMNLDNSRLGADSIRTNLKDVMETVFALMTNVLAMVQKALAALVNHIERIEFQSKSGEPIANDPLQGVSRSAAVEKEAQDYADRIITQARALKRNKKKVQQNCNAEATSNALDPKFCHWRHTCDGCGVTPIVGLRYHALNQPDFDYCQGCFELHREDDGEIVFETQQLVRDKRYQKLNQVKARKKGLQRKTLVSKESTFDKDIKVAIERSLEDDSVVGKKVAAEQNEEKCNERTPPMKEDEPCSFHTAQDLKEIESFIDTTIDSVNSFVSGVLMELSDNLIDDVKKGDDVDVSIVKENAGLVKVEVADDLKVDGVNKDSAEDGTPEFTGAVGAIDASEISVKSNVSMLSDELVSVDVGDNSTPPLSPAALLDNEPEIKVVTEGRVCAAADTDPEEGVDVEQGMSPKKDEAEVVTEGRVCAAADTDPEEEVDVEQGMSPKKDEAEVIIVEAEDPEVTSVMSRSSSGESWDMCAEDEAMARAASVIGSALFEQSDILVQSDDSASGIVLSHVGTNVGDVPGGDDDSSTSSNGSSISSHSSSKSSKSSSSINLSSSSSSLSSKSCQSSSSEGSRSSDNSSSSWSAISKALIERWDKELKGLADFGFTDTSKCIEALESLTAANIGCDRDEPVTLHQAVDYLLKHAE